MEEAASAIDDNDHDNGNETDPLVVPAHVYDEEHDVRRGGGRPRARSGSQSKDDDDAKQLAAYAIFMSMVVGIAAGWATTCFPALYAQVEPHLAPSHRHAVTPSRHRRHAVTPPTHDHGPPSSLTSPSSAPPPPRPRPRPRSRTWPTTTTHINRSCCRWVASTSPATPSSRATYRAGIRLALWNHGVQWSIRIRSACCRSSPLETQTRKALLVATQPLGCFDQPFDPRIMLICSLLNRPTITPILNPHSKPHLGYLTVVVS